MMKQLAAAGLLVSAVAFALPADAAMYGTPAPTMQSGPAPTMKMARVAAPWHRVRTAKGTIWVDSRGFALYTFSKDPPGKSTCYGTCAIAWPPFHAAVGAKASGKWSIVQRFGLIRQWAYNGHPLYFWFKDTRPGQVTGDGVDGFHVAR